MIIDLILWLIGIAIATVLIVLILFIKYIKSSPNHNQNKIHNIENYYELTIMLGSGGHTGQLSLLLKTVSIQKLNKLNVLITSSDKSSKTYFQNIFKKQLESQSLKDKVTYHFISRTNEVKQSKITSILTTLKSLVQSIQLIRNYLINTTHFISNGPGTCVPFFFIFFIMRKLKLCQTKLIFIQSWCRVDSISLSGKIIRYFTDKFIVHWEQQKLKYPWTDYYGKIL